MPALPKPRGEDRFALLLVLSASLAGCLPMSAWKPPAEARPDDTDSKTETEETGNPHTGDTEPSDLDGDGVPSPEDCDDLDPTVLPGADELCDGLDNDCDELVDEDPLDPRPWYPDGDGDTYGDGALELLACEGPEGWVPVAGDCDDGDPTVQPGAMELCDERDNDCDGLVDEDVGLVFYADTDGDAWGDPALSREACEAGEGWMGVAGDCDDSNPDVHPGAADACDGVDDDCDGVVDNGAGLIPSWCHDADGDGFGDPTRTLLACEPPEGWVTDDSDCDDDAHDVNPSAPELCNGLDDDCDLRIDEDLDLAWYLDADGDGFGDPSTRVDACAAPEGHVADDRDCDDTNPGIRPETVEHCDGVDEDCDGLVDEGLGFWAYPDADGDGYGRDDGAYETCALDEGFSLAGGDCDDAAPEVNPGATEDCDGVDDDCDGEIDDGLVEALYYLDADDDGFGDPDTAELLCGGAEGWTLDGSDCDDADPAVNPKAVEICGNGVDDDCDGAVSRECLGSGSRSLADLPVQLEGGRAGSLAGAALAALGDLDHDGYDDFLVGAPQDSAGGALAGAVFLLRGPAPEGISSLDDVASRLVGESASSLAGSALAAGGDLDADGYLDAVVGAPGVSSSAGRVYVLRGPMAAATSRTLAGADLRLEGTGSVQFGAAVAGVGDVSGDGVDDLLIGLPDAGSTPRGGAQLFLGPLTAASYAYGTYTTYFTGASSEHAGASLGAPGDVDGDGIDDLLVGAPLYSSERGRVALFLGGGFGSGTLSLTTADTLFTGEATGDRAGASLANAGDVDGDGYGDLLIGAPYANAPSSDTGRAYLVLGPPPSGSLGLASADARLAGPSANDAAGVSVAFGGDMDLDGFDEILVGSRAHAHSTGSAWLLYGPISGSLELTAAGLTLEGVARLDMAGVVSPAGNSDGEGGADLLVGAPGATGAAADIAGGIVYLLPGAAF